MMIAFLGMGLLGSNFVRALRRRGQAVNVWNRNPDRAKALEADGAKVFADVAEAVRGASRIHITLTDDAVVDDVLERARAGFEKNVIVVDHTTTSPAGTTARAAKWAERGVEFLHAPVFMGPQNALESTGIMLASGDKSRFDTLEPELAKMTGKVMYLGPDPARAAGYKLVGNSLLMQMVAGLTDTLGVARSVGISPTEVGALLESFNPAALLGVRLKRIMEGKFNEPSWELAMARKDTGLMIDAAKRGDVALAILPALAAEMDRWIAKGHAHDDWTVIAKDIVS
jgi:3-hydroxyisobutyrate dehydrogenase